MRPARSPQLRRSQDAARRIRDLMRAEMHRGAYSEGRLPSEEVLMRQMQVARAVIREALALLRDEGLIERIQGIGTVMVSSPVAITIEESQGVPARGSTAPTPVLGRPRLIDHSEIQLPRSVARRLGVAENSIGVRVDYVAIVAGEPIAVATNYMRMPEAAKLVAAKFTTDYYAYLASVGLSVAETSFLMEATVADETDANLLKVTPGAPILAAEQTMFDADGAAFNYALVRARGDRSAILSRSTRRPVPPVLADRGESTADHT